MLSKLQQQLTTLQQVLASQRIPRSQDEVFQLTANALDKVFGQLRILFYPVAFPPSVDPFSLVPCPARQLGADLFVCNAANGLSCFSFRTDQPHYAPIVAASLSLGLIFFERLDQPLTEIEQALITLLTTQTAYHLLHLDETANNRTEGRDQGSTPLSIDAVHHRLYINGVALPLKGKQLAVLRVLYKHRGFPCSRALIGRSVYPDDWACDRRLDRLDMVVFKLRKKLSGSPIKIETVPGVGYQLTTV